MSDHLDMNFYSPVIPPFFRCSPQHFTYSDVKFIFNTDFISFCVVRNPYERVESEYFYRTKNMTFKPEFNFWLLENLKLFEIDNYHSDNHFRLQSDFIGETTKRYRFSVGIENIIINLSKRYGLPEPAMIPHYKKSDKTDILWSREARNKFNKIYNQDFKFLKYEKL
jgi:hypothetical protein